MAFKYERKKFEYEQVVSVGNTVFLQLSNQTFIPDIRVGSFDCPVFMHVLSCFLSNYDIGFFTRLKCIIETAISAKIGFYQFLQLNQSFTDW